MTNLNSNTRSGVSGTPLSHRHANSEVCSEAGFSFVHALIRKAKSGVYALLIALVAACVSQAIWAQETSTITGTVTDPSGAVVANATVTVIQTETGTKQSTVTNSVGLYNIPGLAVGQYTLNVTAQGFSAFQTTGLTVNAAQTVRQDIRLALGSSSQTVTVEASVLQVQTETNEVSRTITGQQVVDIATNGRNITSLTTLGTGVSSMAPSFNGVTAQNSVSTISFNGLRPDHNNFLVNGGEVYDRGSGGKLDVLPSPDSIGQFQVMSSNYAPDYGIASGGTVLVELKSGTGRYHGGVWEFIRNDALDADYFFSKLHGTPTPELRLNIFGGNLGGPVPFLRKKTFFFVNEEWRRYIAGVNPTVTPTVPANNFPGASGPVTYTPWNCPASGCAAPTVPDVPGNAAYTAQLTAAGLVPGAPFPGDQSSGYTIPASLIDNNARLFMGTGAIPMPTPGTDTFVGSPKQPTYVREDVVRIDHNFNDRFHLMGSWIHDSMEQTIIPVQWSGDSYDTVGDVFNNPSWGTAVRLTQAISPSILNETGFYVNGNKIDVTPEGIFAQPPGWNAGSFFPPANNPANKMPQIAFSNGPINTTYTTIYWPWHNSYLNYQIRDDLTWTRGKHTFKFGASYMRMDKNQQLQADTQGDYNFSGSQYTGSSYLNFLLGLSSSYAQLQEQRTDYWLANNYAGYVNDNWRIVPRLTLNLGLRYDAMPHTFEKFNNVSNFVPSTYDPNQAATFNNSGTICTTPDVGTNGCSAPSPGLATFNNQVFYLNGMQRAGVNGFPRGLVKNDFFTWQPRIGFAYDLRGNGKTVLRGGIGFFYERVQGNDIYNLDTAPPFSYQPSVNNVFFSAPTTSITTGATSSIPVATTSPVSMSYYYPHPGTTQFSFGVQQQVAPAVVAAVQYVGSGAWNQNMRIETNPLALDDLVGRQAVATSCRTWVPIDGVNTCPNPDANHYRPFVGYSNLIQERNGANATYNSLQAALRMESHHGLSVELAYTWSHAIDIQSADLTTANEAGTSTISNPFNIRYDRGSGLFDRRHIFNANYIYAEPFFRNGNAWQRTLLGGWTLSGVTQAQSGTPQNIYYNGPDVLGLGGNAVSRPNIISAVTHPKTQTQWFSTSSFANPVAPWNGGANDGFGNAGKDTITAPGLFNWNLSLFKSFPLSPSRENVRFEFRAESFNTFNHTQFNTIDSGTADATYGQVTSTYDPRVFQFGGKIMF
jgi:Carboxypeptidase regulatory-like domain